MTPTEELRKILDEMGVEYEEPHAGFTIVRTKNAVCKFYETPDEPERGVFAVVTTDWLTPAQAIAATVGPKITGDTSDGWHSFKDLYHHRALLFSVIVHNYRDMCWKSKRHDDGTELDWNFIVGIDTPWGQASYHYGMDYWDMFDCKVLERAPKYDGYTPEQSVERIAKLMELDAATAGAGTCKAKLYKPEYGTSDCTVCECGEINDISAIHCNRCGKRIEVGER